MKLRYVGESFGVDSLTNGRIYDATEGQREDNVFAEAVVEELGDMGGKGGTDFMCSMSGAGLKLFTFIMFFYLVSKWPCQSCAGRAFIIC